MPITRTAWIDDDGTGTTGTVINNAEKTLLYDQIDAAIAAATGAQTGDLLFSPDATYDIGKNLANRPRDLFVSRSAKIAAWTIPASGEISSGIVSQGNNFCFLSPASCMVGNAGSAANSSLLFMNANGTVGSIATNGSATAFNTTSDRRLKIDGGPAEDLSALRGLTVHEFTWLADGLRDRGVFAQEAIRVCPRAVTAGSDGIDLSRPWMTDYSKFVPDLIVGWQSHEARLAALEARLKER